MENEPTSVPPQDTTRYAGFWKRVVASFIDGFFLGMAQFSLNILLYGFLGQKRAPLIGLIVIPFIIIVNVAYYVAMESSTWQATLGKRAMGIIVTDAAGARISRGKAAGRYFAKIISGLTLGIGFIMAGFTTKKQGLHDIIADTLVVMK